MGNFVYITLDTTAPQNPVMTIEGDAVYTTNQLVTLNIGVDDPQTSGYSMLIWGSVDATYNASIQGTEGASSWIPYSTNPQVRLSSEDGAKSISVRIRDEVHNPSSITVDGITMDTTIATVTTTVPDVSKISRQTGKDTASFTFTASEDFSEFKVKLVGSTGANEGSGVQISTVGGSTNTSGTEGYSADQVITVTLKGEDLANAGASSESQSIIKVFVKDLAGIWSV